MNGRSVYPFAGHVVGEYAVCVVYGRGHIISGILHGLCRSLKGVPVRNKSLHFIGIVCSENLRRNLTVVDQKSRAALPRYALEHAVGIRYDILCVAKLLGKIIGSNAKFLHAHGIFCIYIFQSVVRFDQEQVNLVVRRRVSLRQELLVQIVLICVVIVRRDRPDNIYVTDLAMRSVNLLIARIMIRDTALKFLVPAVNIKHFALCCLFRRCR